MVIDPQIQITDDGSQTLIHPILTDSYHSLRGALDESVYIFINHAFKYFVDSRKESVLLDSACPRNFNDEVDSEPVIRVFEVGFGSGLNALLTAMEAERLGVKVDYHTVELYPVSEKTVAKLDYPNQSLFRQIHAAKWGESVEINNRFAIKKMELSLLDYKFDTTFDVVYFDAFAPDTQPELWSEEVFAKLYSAMSRGGVLATYSSKGTVKQNLRNAGFEVTRLPGPVGKRHIVRAIKR